MLSRRDSYGIHYFFIGSVGGGRLLNCTGNVVVSQRDGCQQRRTIQQYLHGRANLPVGDIAFMANGSPLKCTGTKRQWVVTVLTKLCIIFTAAVVVTAATMKVSDIRNVSLISFLYSGKVTLTNYIS